MLRVAQRHLSEQFEPRLPDSRIHAFHHTQSCFFIPAITQIGEILLYPSPFLGANRLQIWDPVALSTKCPCIQQGGIIRKGFLEEVDLRGSGWHGCREEGMPGERYSLVKPGVGRQAGQWERLHMEAPGKVRLGAE